MENDRRLRIARERLPDQLDLELAENSGRLADHSDGGALNHSAGDIQLRRAGLHLPYRIRALTLSRRFNFLFLHVGDFVRELPPNKDGFFDGFGGVGQPSGVIHRMPKLVPRQERAGLFVGEVLFPEQGGDYLLGRNYRDVGGHLRNLDRLALELEMIGRVFEQWVRGKGFHQWILDGEVPENQEQEGARNDRDSTASLHPQGSRHPDHGINKEK